MSVVGWQHRNKVQFGTSDNWFALSGSDPALEATAVFMGHDDAVNMWQLNTRTHFVMPTWNITKSSATPATTIVALERSSFRRVFTRVWGRVN